MKRRLSSQKNEKTIPQYKISVLMSIKIVINSTQNFLGGGGGGMPPEPPTGKEPCGPFYCFGKVPYLLRQILGKTLCFRKPRKSFKAQVLSCKYQVSSFETMNGSIGKKE